MLFCIHWHAKRSLGASEFWGKFIRLKGISVLSEDDASSGSFQFWKKERKKEKKKERKKELF